MDYQDVKDQLGSPKLQSIYFLTGEESYYIDKLVQFAEQKIIPEQERDFNQMVLYGRDVSLKTVIEYCREFPFMGTRKLILLKEAQDIKDWETIIPYAKQANDSTILIIAYKNKKPDGRASWVKLLKDKKYFIDFKTPAEYQLPGVIKNLVQSHSLKIETEAIDLLIEFIGNDLVTLDNELEKLKINLPTKTAINRDHIFDNIGISKEYNVFELQKALGFKQDGKVIRILQTMADHIKSNPLIPTIAALYSYYSKLWLTKHNFYKGDAEIASVLKLQFPSYVKEFKEAASKHSLLSLENAIHLLHAFDLKSKGIDSGKTKEEDLFLEMGLKLNQLL